MANLLEVFVESGPAGQIMSANVIGQQCSITLALLLYRLGSLTSVETFREKPECQSHCYGRDKIHMPTESINEHTTSNAVSSNTSVVTIAIIVIVVLTVVVAAMLVIVATVAM